MSIRGVLARCKPHSCSFVLNHKAYGSSPILRTIHWKCMAHPRILDQQIHGDFFTWTEDNLTALSRRIQPLQPARYGSASPDRKYLDGQAQPCRRVYRVRLSDSVERSAVAIRASAANLYIESA